MRFKSLILWVVFRYWIKIIKYPAKKLNWFSIYNVRNTVRITTEWYLEVLKKRKNPSIITSEQIDRYMNEKN